MDKICVTDYALKGIKMLKLFSTINWNPCHSEGVLMKKELNWILLFYSAPFLETFPPYKSQEGMNDKVLIIILNWKIIAQRLFLAKAYIIIRKWNQLRNSE